MGITVKDIHSKLNFMCFGDLNLLIKSQSIIQSFLSTRSVSYDENQFTQFIQFTWLANSSNSYHIATTQEINQIHPLDGIQFVQFTLSAEFTAAYHGLKEDRHLKWVECF